MDCPENGIIFGTAMAEKRLENSKVRYSAAPHVRGAFSLLRVERVKVVSRAERAEGPLDFAIGSDPIVPHGNQEVQVIALHRL